MTTRRSNRTGAFGQGDARAQFNRRLMQYCNTRGDLRRRRDSHDDDTAALAATRNSLSVLNMFHVVGFARVRVQKTASLSRCCGNGDAAAISPEKRTCTLVHKSCAKPVRGGSIRNGSHRALGVLRERPCVCVWGRWSLRLYVAPVRSIIEQVKCRRGKANRARSVRALVHIM